MPQAQTFYISDEMSKNGYGWNNGNGCNSNGNGNSWGACSEQPHKAPLPKLLVGGLFLSAIVLLYYGYKKNLLKD